jgi:NADH:ubiquinone oxidoreductase subunit E
MMNETESVSCSCGMENSDDKLFEKLDEILEEYKYKDGGLIPVLQIAQGLFGFLPEDVLRHIAKKWTNPTARWRGLLVFTPFSLHNHVGITS